MAKKEYLRISIDRHQMGIDTKLSITTDTDEGFEEIADSVRDLFKALGYSPATIKEHMGGE